MTGLVDVVAAVIVEHGTVFACRRAPGRRAAGLWEFPGGKVEPGESREDALRREFLEELGVPIQVGAVLVEARENGIHLTCFEASLVDARPTASTDHDLLEWLPFTALGSVPWALPDRPAVALLQQRAR